MPSRVITDTHRSYARGFNAAKKFYNGPSGERLTRISASVLASLRSLQTSLKEASRHNDSHPELRAALCSSRKAVRAILEYLEADGESERIGLNPRAQRSKLSSRA